MEPGAVVVVEETNVGSFVAELVVLVPVELPEPDDDREEVVCEVGAALLEVDCDGVASELDRVVVDAKPGSTVAVPELLVEERLVSVAELLRPLADEVTSELVGCEVTDVDDAVCSMLPELLVTMLLVVDWVADALEDDVVASMLELVLLVVLSSPGPTFRLDEVEVDVLSKLGSTVCLVED